MSWDTARIPIRVLHVSKRSATIARHMGLSSRRKFDVLTLTGGEVRIYIYRVTRAHMARDKNARRRLHACERKTLGRSGGWPI